jgi:hypothetical protein
VPRPLDDRDLGNLLCRLFRSESDVERLSHMRDARFARLAPLVFPPNFPRPGLVCAARSLQWPLCLAFAAD